MNIGITGPPQFVASNNSRFRTDRATTNPMAYGGAGVLCQLGESSSARQSRANFQFSSFVSSLQTLDGCVLLEVSKAVGKSSQKLAHVFFRSICRESHLPYRAVGRFGYALFYKIGPVGTDSSNNDVSTTTTGQCSFPVAVSTSRLTLHTYHDGRRSLARA